MGSVDIDLNFTTDHYQYWTVNSGQFLSPLNPPHEDNFIEMSCYNNFICEDDCDTWTCDGICDDGGPGSEYSRCLWGNPPPSYPPSHPPPYKCRCTSEFFPCCNPVDGYCYNFTDFTGVSHNPCGGNGNGCRSMNAITGNSNPTGCELHHHECSSNNDDVCTTPPLPPNVPNYIPSPPSVLFRPPLPNISIAATATTAGYPIHAEGKPD